MIDISETLDVEPRRSLDNLWRRCGVVQVDFNVLSIPVCRAREEAAVFWSNGQIWEIVANGASHYSRHVCNVQHASLGYIKVVATSMQLVGVVDSSMGENATTPTSSMTRIIYVTTYGGYVNLERLLKYPIFRLPSLPMEAIFIILLRGMND